MSASIPVTNSPIQSVAEWRKRSNPGDYTDSSILSKRQRCQYYYILASESSMSEDERSESVDSIQDQETDLCKDTTDTDTKSEQSDDDMNVEYEIVSSSEPEENPFADGSSSGEDALIAAGAVAATIANESDVEIWVTDEDDETDSVTSIIESQLLYGQKCKRCKIRETVSCFLCSHCYQIRKNCRPLRPRKPKKPKTLESHNSSSSVTTEGLSACLNVLSQDSGLGSSQELMQSTSSQLQTLAWDQVVVPENLIKSTNSICTPSASSLSPAGTISTIFTDQTMENWKTAAGEMCILCNAMPKNGMFVHSTTGHMCCCYNCAVKFWTKSKRCAWCNLKARNVIKAFLG